MAAKKGLTAETYAEALTKANGNISLAAKMLGVDRKAVQYAMQQYASVREAHDEAANHVTDIAEGHLVNAVLKGQWDQVRYWLETKAKDRGYGAGRADPSLFLTADELAAMPDAKLDELRKKLSKLAGSR